jgi:hypothetical protein
MLFQLLHAAATNTAAGAILFMYNNFSIYPIITTPIAKENRLLACHKSVMCAAMKIYDPFRGI